MLRLPETSSATSAAFLLADVAEQCRVLSNRPGLLLQGDRVRQHPPRQAGHAFSGVLQVSMQGQATFKTSSAATLAENDSRWSGDTGSSRMTRPPNRRRRARRVSPRRPRRSRVDREDPHRRLAPALSAEYEHDQLQGVGRDREPAPRLFGGPAGADPAGYDVCISQKAVREIDAARIQRRDGCEFSASRAIQQRRCRRPCRATTGPGAGGAATGGADPREAMAGRWAGPRPRYAWRAR